MLYGMDISNYQKNINLALCPCDFVIMKATEGKTMRDKSFERFALSLTTTETLLGCYHFARPDLHKTKDDIEAESINFVNAVKSVGLIGKAILCLDWEKNPIDNDFFMKVWLEKIEELTGVVPFIYANGSTMKVINGWEFTRNYPKWVAKWPTAQRFVAGATPGIDHRLVGYPDWKIWQYSNVGNYPGYSGRVDLDMANITRGEWKKMARMKLKEDVEEELTDDMKWAIRAGLFIGYTDGSYKPEEPVTRQMLATILRRYYNRF